VIFNHAPQPRHHKPQILHYAAVLFLFSVLSSILLPVRAYALNLDKAQVYFLNEDYLAAIDECEAILAQKMSSRELDKLYYLLGVSYMKAGNLLRASDIFDIIINEYPHSKLVDDAYISRGDAYLLMEDFSRAKENYIYIINHRSKSNLKASAYYKLALVSLKEGDWAASKLYFNMLNKDFPLSFEARLSKSLIKQDNFQENFFSVQVGSFLNKRNADNLKETLEKKGFSSYVVEALSKSRKFYRVRVGRFKNRSDAQEMERRLANLGYPTKIYP